MCTNAIIASATATAADNRVVVHRADLRERVDQSESGHAKHEAVTRRRREGRNKQNGKKTAVAKYRPQVVYEAEVVPARRQEGGENMWRERRS